LYVDDDDHHHHHGANGPQNPCAYVQIDSYCTYNTALKLSKMVFGEAYAGCFHSYHPMPAKNPRFVDLLRT